MHMKEDQILFTILFVFRCRYRIEMDAIMARWRRLGSTLADSSQRIQELMAKLMQFEVRQRRRR